MSVDVAMEFSGLKEALKELNRIDKKLRRQITKDFKTIVKPVVAQAKSDLPSTMPLSGMARSWKGNSGAELMNWMNYRVSKNIKAFTSGKTVREAPSGFKQNLGVFGIRWAGPQATIFDMAAKGMLGRNLTNRFGMPSRVIYKAYKSSEVKVRGDVVVLVNKVMRQTNNAMRMK